MLKGTDSAAMTKANVTMAYIRQECISLSYNCPRIGRTELYGAPWYQRPVLLFHCPLFISWPSGYPITVRAPATIPTFQPAEGRKRQWKAYIFFMVKDRTRKLHIPLCVRPVGQNQEVVFHFCLGSIGRNLGARLDFAAGEPGKMQSFDWQPFSQLKLVLL